MLLDLLKIAFELRMRNAASKDRRDPYATPERSASVARIRVPGNLGIHHIGAKDI